MEIKNLSGHAVQVAVPGRKVALSYPPEKDIITFPATENREVIDGIVVRTKDFRGRTEKFEPETLIFVHGGNKARPRALYMDSSGMIHTLSCSYKSTKSDIITSIISHSDVIFLDEHGWPEVEVETPSENGSINPGILDRGFKLIDDIMNVQGSSPQEKYQARVKLVVKALQ